jgi:hypothetical protein
MQDRMEKVSGDEPVEAVCYNEEKQYYLTLSEVLTSIFPD